MKPSYIFILALLLGPVAQAGITNSKYVARHQALLESAIYSSCGVQGGQITQLTSVEDEIHIDQGVIDVSYATTLELKVEKGPGVSISFNISAQSMMYSGYDHNAQEWGEYRVESVVCELQ